MAGQLRKSVELFYDVISPYSWVGFEVLCRYRQKWSMDLVFKPFLIGGVFQGAGNKPPASVPSKAPYLMKDIERINKYYKLPFNHPKDFETSIVKKGSLLAMRLVSAVQLKQPQKTEDISRELFMRVWSKDLDITLPESLIEASQDAGFSSSDAQDLVGRVKDQEVKDQLKQTTQEALQHGAFGSPSIVAHDARNEKHFIFGSDRFHILAQILEEQELGPLNDLAHPRTRGS